MPEPPNVCLTLSNQPENVLLVRETLSGMAQTVGVDGVELNDIRTAVTEACNNVVLHAYEGGEGLLQIELFVAADSVEVVVRDHGTGIKPHIRDEDDALGIGLSIIQALAPRVEFKDVAGGGTEVRMEFPTPSAKGLTALVRNGFERPDVAASELATTTGLAIAPSALAREVLPRVICVLAARAHFSTDRISDAELVADALAARASESSTGHHLTMSVSVEPRDLELRVGPLSSGSSERLLASSEIDGFGPVIEKLTDDRSVAAHGASEILALRLRDQRS
jgi:serine/threonine-protein kinase RsbW